MIGHCHGYVNNRQSPFICHISIDRNLEKLPPVDHGGPEMNISYLHCSNWEKHTSLVFFLFTYTPTDFFVPRLRTPPIFCVSS